MNITTYYGKTIVPLTEIESVIDDRDDSVKYALSIPEIDEISFLEKFPGNHPFAGNTIFKVFVESPYYGDHCCFFGNAVLIGKTLHFV